MRKNVLMVLILTSLVLTSCITSSSDNTSEEFSCGTKEIIVSNEKLQGLELLQSLEVEMPDSYIFETKSQNAGNIKTTDILYCDGVSFRNEERYDGMTEANVLIYNGFERMFYSLSEIAKSGSYWVSEEDSVNPMTMPCTLLELLETSKEGVVAYIDMVDGEKLLHIERVPEDIDIGDVEIFLFSLETSFLIKYELYLYEEIVKTTVATNLEVDVVFDEKLFEKPDGIAYVDLDDDIE